MVGGLLVAVPLALVEYGAFGALVQPFIWRLIGDGNWYGFVPVHSTATMCAGLVLGLVLMAVGLLAAPAMLRLHARVSRPLLSAPRSSRLARRVERLTDTRARALDAQAAELRRIERNLHDGAQARLVALGMALDRATRLMETDPAAARELLLDVRRTSEGALQDLRELVHGIHPPVLADRGLGDAVRSLALDSFLEARRRRPGLPVLILSQYVEQLYAHELLAGGEGAVEYLLKERVTNTEQFIDAVRRVAAGGTVMGPQLISKLLLRSDARGRIGTLTQRERDVLELMAEGRSNAAVAGGLHISEGAVAKHTASIFTKLRIDPSADDNRRVLAVLAYLKR